MLLTQKLKGVLIMKNNNFNLCKNVAAELIGAEMSLMDLDNAVMSFGLPTAYDDGDEGLFLDNGSISFSLTDCCSVAPEWLNVEFEPLHGGELVKVTAVELI